MEIYSGLLYRISKKEPEKYFVSSIYFNASLLFALHLILKIMYEGINDNEVRKNFIFFTILYINIYIIYL